MYGGPGTGTWPPESFLGRLTPPEREALLARGGHAAYQPGQHLLVDGDRGGFVILVHAGQVKVVMQDEQGIEHLLGIRARGSLLGEQSYVDGQPRSASVVAINQVQASSIAWDKLDLYLRDHPRVSMEIARVLANRLRASDQTGRDIHSNRVPVRVAKLLVELAEAFAEPGRRQAPVIPLSQAEMAQLAHAAEVTVNRVLREFRGRRMVRTAYRKVVVPCVVCLDRLASAVSADPKGGAKSVLGCGGTNSHRSE
ncbi:MAG TPA: Crp/Fnr family transcriptional regulator [Pseudonocardiaceae bacterium]|nr:Crp/Fnr family transcriptional regulator [Pseudonocardiaceae bacterium]